jgi:RNA polymerase sigma factor (sigma-70 family)
MPPGDRDTSIGGAPIAFPETCWSRFLAPPAEGDPSAMEELARRYWKPIYASIRIRWKRSNEDAKDLTQDFFVWMTERSFLDKADPRRGKFRAFVKVALEHYLLTELEKRGRLKRGGGIELKALDEVMRSEDPSVAPMAKQAPPEQVLDAAWKEQLVLQAMTILETQLRNEGKEVAFRIFRDSYGREADGARYGELAARYTLSEQEVFNHLRNARKRCRDIILGLVAQTVQTEAELHEELDALFGDATP